MPDLARFAACGRTICRVTPQRRIATKAMKRPAIPLTASGWTVAVARALVATEPAGCSAGSS